MLCSGCQFNNDSTVADRHYRTTVQGETTLEDSLRDLLVRYHKASINVSLRARELAQLLEVILNPKPNT